VKGSTIARFYIGTFNEPLTRQQRPTSYPPAFVNNALMPDPSVALLPAPAYPIKRLPSLRPRPQSPQQNTNLISSTTQLPYPPKPAPIPHQTNHLTLFNIGLSGWTAAVEVLEPVAPSFWAAGAIANLYNKALADCANFIALGSAPLPHGGTFRIGAIELAFEGNAAVPWELIKSLVGVLYEWVVRGHVSTYTLWITNGAQVFRFILRVGPDSPWGPRGPP